MAIRFSQCLPWLLALIAGNACGAPALLPFDPQTDRPVYGAAAQADGKLVLAGSFQTAQGQARTCLARFNTDGSLDATYNLSLRFNTDRCVVVSLLRQDDGKLLISGTFNFIQNQSRRYVARLDAAGVDPGFVAADIGDSQYVLVNATARQPDGKYLIAGHFQTVANQPRKRIARLLADGSLDATFGDANVDDTISAIALQPDGRILVAGYFTTVAGQPRKYLARLNADGSFDASFNDAGLNSRAMSLALQPDGRVLVGGYFAQPSPGVLRVQSNGAIDTSFIPAATGATYSIALQGDGKVVVAQADPVAAAKVLRFDRNGGAEPGYEYALCCQPAAMEPRIVLQSSGYTIVAGDFSSISNAPRGHAARLFEENVFASGFQ